MQAVFKNFTKCFAAWLSDADLCVRGGL